MPICCIIIIDFMYSHYPFRELGCKHTPLSAWRLLMTSYIFMALEHVGTLSFAKCLTGQRCCNLSLTWLVWPGPITASLSGSSVRQTVNQSGPCSSPEAELHVSHSTSHLIPSSGLLLCRSFACFVHISMWRII